MPDLACARYRRGQGEHNRNGLGGPASGPRVPAIGIAGGRRRPWLISGRERPMHVIEQVLTAAELEAVRAIIGRSRFGDGAASAHGAAKQVKVNQQLECSQADHQRLVEIVFGALHRHRDFSRTALPLEISVPMVNRYGVGMTYGAHYDKPFMPTPDGPRIRGDLSATLFLSNPEDYDGGELCFARVGAQEQIKLNAGDLFLYPASTLHSVAPVTRGERLAVVFWIQSMIREHDKRAVVFELDGLVG